MSYRVIVSCLALAALAGCAKAPTSPAGSTSVTTPALTTPANGATVANAAQPLTLTINDALVTTAGASVTYTFEVASDAAFSSIVTTKDVPQTTGQTSATLDPLTAGRDYYWHVRTKAADTVGVFSSPMKFSIGPAVTLTAPTPLSPLTGSASVQTPTLTVTNSGRSGPVTAVSYRFEIAASSSFSPILVSGTVAEGAGTTSFTSPTSLPANTTFYWRAQAIDQADTATSPYSPPQSVSTILTIDLHTVNYQRFVNVADWPETDKIISVDQDGGDGHMCIDHAMAGLWPTVDFEPLVPVEANQWYFARINGQWYAGAGEWLRPGQICKQGQMSANIGPDGTWGGPMDTWVPKRGDLVGYMITTPARAYPDITTINQRSNVIVQPWVVDGISTP